MNEYREIYRQYLKTLDNEEVLEVKGTTRELAEEELNQFNLWLESQFAEMDDETVH